MNSRIGIRSRPLVVLLTALLVAVAARESAGGPLHASLALEPNPSLLALPGETVFFDVLLQDFAPDASQAIISFSLDFSASDPLLTASSFSRFSFALDSTALSGRISLAFDNDLSDGSVAFGANLPILGGADTGILDGDDGIRLGVLSVEAPDALGSYDVSLFVDTMNPTFGTHLVVDQTLLLTVPGDGALAVTNSSIDVVPEPSSLILLGIGGTCCVFAGVRRRRLTAVGTTR